MGTFTIVLKGDFLISIKIDTFQTESRYINNLNDMIIKKVQANFQTQFGEKITVLPFNAFEE